MPPHALATPSVVGRRTEPAEALTTLTLLSVFMAVMLGGWIVFLLHGLPPLASLFDIVSALGTVGLSAGVVGPDLPDHLKILLAVVMLAGRLEGGGPPGADPSGHLVRNTRRTLRCGVAIIGASNLAVSYGAAADQTAARRDRGRPGQGTSWRNSATSSTAASSTATAPSRRS